MTRLIDAEELKKVFMDEDWETDRTVCGLIDRQKTVEAVPVVRCKDCKYNSNTEGNYVLCDIIPQMFGKTPDDNYCSWAERKQE